MNPGAPQLLTGRVFHERLRPAKHRFTVPVFFLRIPLSKLPGLGNALLSVDRWNLFSFMNRDHGPRDGSAIEPWVRKQLARAGMGEADGEIVLQAFPRMLGYVFNPISVFYCHDRAGALRAILCEVANTFGEHHNYLLAHGDRRAIANGDWLTARKVFHVSPFCEVEGHYRFRFSGSLDRQYAQIDYHDAGGKLIVTTIHGRGDALSARRLFSAFFAFPWMTAGVTARIHWQAFRLWLKRVPWFSKPAPPLEETTR